MKTQLLKKQIAFIPIMIEMFFFSAAHAQIVYTDVIPDHLSSCTSGCNGGSVCTTIYNIDINQDGQDDFRITTSTWPPGSIPFPHPCGALVDAIGLNGNEIAGNDTGQVFPNALAFDVNSEISSGNWTSGTLTLKRVGTFPDGMWPQVNDKYLGVRLLIGANFYYGWIRLNLSLTGSAAQCTVKDFAFNSIPDSSILASQACPGTPQINVTSNGDTTICIGETVLLTANYFACDSASILWSTGETTPNIFVDTSGTYAVTITDGNGNSASAQVSLSLNPDPAPTVDISPDGSTAFCHGNDVVLTADAYPVYSYLWSTGAHTQSITANSSGFYVVTVTNASGCSNLDSITVTVFSPEPVITENGNELCTGAFAAYQWSMNGSTINGATDQCYNAIQSGFYYVGVADQNNCSGTSAQFYHITTGAADVPYQAGFIVNPNPASDKITLSFSSLRKKQIQITNTLGQIVFAEEINSAKEEIDVSEFPAGMYVVSAQTSTQKIEKKFLKQ